MRLCLALCLTLSASTGSAFVVSGNFWEAGQATYRVGMTGSSPSGTSWNTAFKRAMDAWSNATNFQFLAVDSFKDPCAGRLSGGFGDNVSSVNFTADVCGNAFGENTLAVTLTAGTCLNQQCTGGFKITDADIVFRANEPWDIYSGPLQNETTDFERVALHELGHALGLRHETSSPAVMQALVSDTHTLQADDINGANAIYPAVEPPLTTISSIYGVNITLPSTPVLAGPGNSVSLSGTLASGDASLDGKLLDLYQLTFSNDSQVDILLNSTAIDPFLYLVRINSAQEAIPGFTFTDDDSGSGTNAQITQSIPAGTYWIGVSSSKTGQQGNYSLTVVSADRNPKNSFETFQSIYGVGVQINPNPSFAGSLSSGDFELNGKRLDLYQFTLNNQTTLRIDLTSSAFNTVLLLVRLHPNGTASAQEIDESFLFQNDNFGLGTNSRIEQVLPPGNYWIGVTSAVTGQTGDYQVEASVVIP